MVNLAKSTLKVALSTLCVAVLATGCSNNNSNPAPAPSGPAQPKPDTKKQEPKPEPQAEPQPQPAPQKPAEPAPQPEPIVPAPPKPVPPVAPSEPAQPAQPAPQSQSEPAQTKPVEPAPPPELSTTTPDVEATDLKAAAEETSRKVGFKIILSPSITREDALRGLKVIEDSMPAVKTYHYNLKPVDPKYTRLEPLFDVLILGNRTSGNHKAEESHGHMVFKLQGEMRFWTERYLIDHSQLPQIVNDYLLPSAEEAATFMLKFNFFICEKDALGEPGSPERLSNCKEVSDRKDSHYNEVMKFRKLRAEYNAISAEFPGVNLQCKLHGKDSTEHCLEGARTFKAVAQRANSGSLAAIKRVVISKNAFKRTFSAVSIENDAKGETVLDFVYNESPEDLAIAIGKYSAQR